MSGKTLVWGQAILIAMLLPLIYGMPVDQTWMGGLYDGGDSDSLIFAIKCTKGLTASDSPVPVPVGSFRGLVPVVAWAHATVSTLHPSDRAPPSSVSA